MGRVVTQWTDARLNQLADVLEPVPVQVAVLDATVDHLAAAFEPMPAQIAVLAAAVDRLTDENRALRTEFASTQRQLLQIAWGLVAAWVGEPQPWVTALIWGRGKDEPPPRPRSPSPRRGGPPMMRVLLNSL